MVRLCRLRCEHYESALGVSTPRPRLSWSFEGDELDWHQAGYTVKVTRDGKAETYEVSSSESVLVPWASAPLKSGEAADVEVQAKGSDGGMTGSANLRVEAGLLEHSDWHAQVVCAEKQPSDQPKRPFRVFTSLNVPAAGSARLYISALGMYEAYLNGEHLGKEYLAPGWTSYHTRLHYQVYDITDRLKPGRNVLGAWVAEGWYAGRLAWGKGKRNQYGEDIGLIAQVVLNGRVVAATGEGWKWSYGAVHDAEIYDGEVFDSRVADDWSEGGMQANGAEWSPCRVLPLPSATPTTSQAPPVREIERIPAVEIIHTPSGATIVDFGQNFAGVMRILAEPPRSSERLVIRHAEVLEHGELGTRPLRAAKARNEIILGGPVKGYQPRFTFFGFRYAQIDGWPGVTTSDVVGIVIASDMEETGTFSCSHRLLNRLHRNVYYSTRSNTISVPTDCPQRDERLGWTGDIQVFAPTMLYMLDSAGFLVEWLQDLKADQAAANAVVPLVIPDVDLGIPHMAQAIWGDVAVLTPRDVYTASADREVLRTQYSSITSWLDRGIDRDPETRLWVRGGFQFADWLAPQADPAFPERGPTDVHLVADAYLVHTTQAAARIAEILERRADAERYAADADALLTVFLETYVTARARVVSDSQTALALILHFDLIRDAPHRAIFAKRLGELAIFNFWQVSTGFAGTPIILQTLAEHDMLHHAYRMLLARDCPSWLSPVLLGATTIWERWDSMLSDGSINPGEMTSFNHYALGSVAAFMHGYIGGLRPLEPGWKTFLVKPQPGGDLTWGKTGCVTPYGKASCEWEIKDGTLEVEVVVPPNATARVELGGKVEQVGSGRRTFSVEWERDGRWPPPFAQPPGRLLDKDWVRG